jgi:hypothetical protein
MMQVWIKTELPGTNQGPRLLITLPDNAANKLAVALDAEFRDMKVAIEVWVED